MNQILIAFSVILAILTDRIVVTVEVTKLPSYQPVAQDIDKCKWGRRYWCYNFKKAKECNKFDHCIEDWKKMDAREDNDHVCKMCQNMVQQARDQFASGQTYEDLENIFERSCKSIQIKSLFRECIDIANEYIPKFVDEPGSQVKPLVVCWAARLCHCPRIDELIAEHEASS